MKSKINIHQAVLSIGTLRVPLVHCYGTFYG